jgi:2-haloacid dehalogenase
MTSGRPAPGLLVLDVNETLSDLSPLADRFGELGLPAELAQAWFAGVLRDGFALTVTGDSPAFADVATDGLRDLLRRTGQDGEDLEAGVETVMAAFGDLPVHPDVVEGVQLLHRLGIQLVTLSNGSTSVARGLCERNDISDCFTALLSVEEAPGWKPAEAAYRWALETTGFEAADAMLVAVHPWDLHGAHHAGLGTAWINRSGAAYPRTFHGPDLEAESLVDLAAQLGAVSA